MADAAGMRGERAAAARDNRKVPSRHSLVRWRYAPWRAAVLLLIAPLVLVSVGAQPRTLTLDDIYGPTSRIGFSGAVPSGLTWMDRSRLAWPRNIGEGVTWTAI